jgi:hypothetical protein
VLGSQKVLHGKLPLLYTCVLIYMHLYYLECLFYLIFSGHKYYMYSPKKFTYAYTYIYVYVSSHIYTYPCIYIFVCIYKFNTSTFQCSFSGTKYTVEGEKDVGKEVHICIYMNIYNHIFTHTDVYIYINLY